MESLRIFYVYLLIARRIKMKNVESKNCAAEKVRMIISNTYSNGICRFWIFWIIFRVVLLLLECWLVIENNTESFLFELFFTKLRFSCRIFTIVNATILFDLQVKFCLVAKFSIMKKSFLVHP